MPTMAALVRSERLAAELSLLSASRDVLRLCDGPGALRAALAGGADLAFLELHDGNAAALPVLLRELRAAHPSLAIVVHCSPGSSVSATILSVAQAGASTLLLDGFDELETSLKTVLTVENPAAAVAWVARTVAPLVPGAVAEVMQCVATDARLSPSVQGLCSHLHTNRRTLAYRLQRTGFPPPHTIVAWTRLLAAARFLEHTCEPVEKVAVSLGFRSGAAMRTLFLRLTRLTPSAARAPGGYERALAMFLRTGTARALGDADRSRTTARRALSRRQAR